MTRETSSEAPLGQVSRQTGERVATPRKRCPPKIEAWCPQPQRKSRRRGPPPV